MAEQVGSAAAPRGGPRMMRATAFGALPPAIAFDVAHMLEHDWGHRFLISADAVVENHAFLIYGARFARLLGLPEMPVPLLPVMPQLPERYRAVFAKGCADALAERGPVRLSGIFEGEDGEHEAYRAAFAPVAVQPNSLVHLIYGAFNRRILHAALRLRVAAG